VSRNSQWIRIYQFLPDGRWKAFRFPDYKHRVSCLNAEDLTGVEDGSTSHALSTFVLSFTSDPTCACAEMHRVVGPGGLMGLATWSRISWVSVWERTVREAGKAE
jgi:hypothetical protein